MAPRTVFITGANRGIGLGLIKEILKLTGVESVIGGCRNPDQAEELMNTANNDKRLHVLKVDVSCDKSLQNAVSEVEKIVGDKGLNLLINNAGICEKYGTSVEPNRSAVSHCIDVNAVSALITSQMFLPLVQKAAEQVNGDDLSVDRAAIINIGSDCSSQTLNKRGSGPSQALLAYKMSKVAMLSFAKTMAFDLSAKNIPVLVTTIHPGWVQTDMGGSNAEITVDESVSKIVAGFEKLNKQHAGGLYDRNIEAMPF